MAKVSLGALVLAGLIAGFAAHGSAAARKLVVGIPPFDVAAAGGDSSAGQVLSKLIRIEMMKSVRLQPVLLTEVPKPAAEANPAPAATSADAAKTGAATPNDVLLIGTVLAAEAGQTSQNVTSPSMFGGSLTIGGRVGRSTATVSLHIELVAPKTGDTIDSFDVDSKSSETGVGTDLQTAMGSYDSGDPSFDKSPMGKALRDAAQKIAAEIVKRADRLMPKS
jgi:hypothetical protein